MKLAVSNHPPSHPGYIGWWLRFCASLPIVPGDLLLQARHTQTGIYSIGLARSIARRTASTPQSFRWTTPGFLAVSPRCSLGYPPFPLVIHVPVLSTLAVVPRSPLRPSSMVRTILGAARFVNQSSALFWLTPGHPMGYPFVLPLKVPSIREPTSPLAVVPRALAVPSPGWPAVAVLRFHGSHYTGGRRACQ